MLDVPIGYQVELDAVREAVLGLRRGKGMVIDPGDPDSVSAGSFFTNPILDPGEWAALPGDPPGWPEPDGRIKTSAAWLIERAGFDARVRRRPRRDLDQAHARADQPRRGDDRGADGARARDRRRACDETFGIELTPEPVLVGHRW